MLRVAVLGAGGRMGRALLRAVADAPDMQLAGALVRPGSELVGQVAMADRAGVGSAGNPSEGAGADDGVAPPVLFTDQPVAALDAADVAIDFSLPQAASSNAAAAANAGCTLVIGTTGLQDGTRHRLREVAQSIPIVAAPNMSVGINLCFHFAAQAARARGPEYDVEIFEIHHRDKRDAPSGTALRFGEVIAEERGRRLNEIAEYDRHDANRPREPGAIGFAVQRMGGVVGDHTVSFGSRNETIEIRHRAADRAAFADGALRAARWAAAQPPGLYTMHDVLMGRGSDQPEPT